MWNKISSLLEKGFNKYIKTKIKNYSNKKYTNFQYNEIPKDNEYCTCLSVILLDCIFVNSDKKYYSQIFLEECKYAIKKKKTMNTINEELELTESDDEFDGLHLTIKNKLHYRQFSNHYEFNNLCYDLLIQY